MRSSYTGRLAGFLVLLLGALGLAACDSSGSNGSGGVDTVSGSVSGLATGQSVLLELNQASTVTVTASGAFTFPTGVGTNGTYSVTVVTQPQGQTCTIKNGRGTGMTSNVANVQVTCTTLTYSLSGTLTGLEAGSHVVLENHGKDALTLTTDGSFTFSTPVAFDGTYAVTVATEPEYAVCTVQHGTGAGVTADVTSIAVMCSSTAFTIGGTLSGLTNGMQVTLENNSADPLTLSANGPFTFSTAVAKLGAYNVGVSTEPAGQTCSVTNGQGTQVTRNVANITVGCTTNTYTIGGSVAGLGSGQQVTLEDDGGDSLTVTGNGPFIFATPIAYGGVYNVTVGTQPVGATCVVTNGMASPVTADVTNVGISCVPNTVSFTTPGSYTWTVPAGITSISIVATGGGGGGGGATLGGGAGTVGGAGAIVTSTLSVTPGQVLDLVVGGGGQGGTSPPACGTGGGGGGSTNVDAGASDQIIAGGGGGGGPSSCGGSAGGSAGGAGGAGGNGGTNAGTGGGGGSGGIGGAGGSSFPGGPAFGTAGGNGDGGAGGAGGYNGPYAGGAGGSGVGSGSGGNSPGAMGGGGGGGYGGGGSGGFATGGGAGGSTGPSGTTYAPASNGGGSATNGGDGSIVITLQ